MRPHRQTWPENLACPRHVLVLPAACATVTCSFAIKRLCKTSPSLDTGSVVWCVTVPAMWDEAAKAKLRGAANRAGACVV